MRQKQRIRKRLPYFWMSFADETGFLGVIILRGRNVLDYVRRAHALKINPGGQVATCELDREVELPVGVTARLLDRKEIERLMPELKPTRLGDWNK